MAKSQGRRTGPSRRWTKPGNNKNTKQHKMNNKTLELNLKRISIS